jgi:hypothetical protein
MQNNRGLDQTYKAQHLHATGVEFVLQLCKGAQLRGADRCEVGGVREQDRPFSVEKFVELDLAVRGLRLEVWRDRADP